MDGPLMEYAEVCQGAIRVRTLCGVPTMALICLGCLAAGLLYFTPGGWVVRLAISVASGAVWGWLKWQTKRDPQWMQTWWQHLHVKDVYHS